MIKRIMTESVVFSVASEASFIREIAIVIFFSEERKPFCIFSIDVQSIFVISFTRLLSILFVRLSRHKFKTYSFNDEYERCKFIHSDIHLM